MQIENGPNLTTSFTYRVPIWMKKSSEDNAAPDESRLLRASKNVNYKEASTQESGNSQEDQTPR